MHVYDHIRRIYEDKLKSHGEEANHWFQSSSISELVELAMSMFDSHVFQEVCAVFFSWATCSNAKDRTSEHLAMPLY